MTVYHGGYCEISKPEIRVGKYTKDFGAGFYCTEIKSQAKRWSLKYETPVITVFEYMPDESADILLFETMSEEWLDFVVACRANISHNHDIVIGAMADDQVYNFINDFIDGTISREAFWALAKFKHPTHQIAFCTPRALKCLKFLESEGN
ncbi:MAG: DUF3990 domain-containing protein [Oscillospiraceae bacterium]|nr:DUF3990 domain-containing protein [Oscillospiraceae bacterium]